MNISSTTRKNLIKQQTPPVSQDTKAAQNAEATLSIPMDTVEFSTKEKALVGAGLVALGAGSLALLTLAPSETLMKMAAGGATVGVVTAGIGFVATGKKEGAIGTGMLGFTVGSGMAAGGALLASAAASGATPGGGGALIASLLCGGAFTSLSGLGIAAPLLGGQLILEAGQEAFQ